jgi:invasion protein IalB
MQPYRSSSAIRLLLILSVAFGAPAQAQTQQVSPTAYSISGWRVECSSQSNALACQLIDQVTARANNGVIAGISVVQAGAAKTPTLVVQVPLGAALDQPVRMGFNSGAEQMVPFVSCYNNGCFARATLQDSLLSQMRDAKEPLSVSYSTYDANMNKQSIRITLPLDGFAVAYDKLK